MLDELQGNPPVILRVVGEINICHAAPPELLQDLVMTDGLQVRLHSTAPKHNHDHVNVHVPEHVNVVVDVDVNVDVLVNVIGFSFCYGSASPCHHLPGRSPMAPALFGLPAATK
jgi:hypothetical protein